MSQTIKNKNKRNIAKSNYELYFNEPMITKRQILLSAIMNQESTNYAYKKKDVDKSKYILLLNQTKIYKRQILMRPITKY